MTRPLLLLVEDEPEIREITEAILEDRGFTVVTASDGKRALALLDAIETCPPNLIVTDMMMPVMDGLQFLREYQERRTSLAPVLAVSAMAGYLDEATKLGAAGVLQKPFGTESLSQAVQCALSGIEGKIPALTISNEEEQRRLRTVVDLMMDKPAREPELEAFVSRIADFFDVPVCLLTTVTDVDQFWSAGCGIPSAMATTRRDPRSSSFCTHAVAARSALVVQDAADNPFFKENIWVRERGLRFYAGVPLIHHTGDALGTLCIIDFRPRVFTHHDLALLSVLARRILADIEWRERDRHGAGGRAKHQAYIDRELGVLGRDAFVDLCGIEALRAIEQQRSLTVLGVRAAPSDMQRSADGLATIFDHAWVGRLADEILGVATSAVAPSAAVESVRRALGDDVMVVARTVHETAAVPGLALREIERVLMAE